MYALIADENMFKEDTTYQIIEFSYVSNNRNIMIDKSFYFKPLYKGEMEFTPGTQIPKGLIKTRKTKEIIKFLFTGRHI